MQWEIKNYSILVYGGPNGYDILRAQIGLKGEGKSAWVRFHDPGMAFPEDDFYNDIIRMHLPTSMFQSVLDILRNEKPVYAEFNNNKAKISLYAEGVGEGEINA